MPDHLFISYATEDFVLAEWLSRMLTALGYRVWCDRFELLGGERFPRDIDKAIKEDTFRMIALISKISIQKDGPTKERTLALNIGKERKIDFLIPLLLEPLSPSELDWMMSDITNIPFHQGWAIGLQQLVQKLDKIQTSQPLNNSFAAAADSLLPKNVLDVRQETLHSNILRVQRIPEVIKRFVLQRQPTPDDEAVILQVWPSFQADQTTRLAFLPPPRKLCDKLTIMPAGGAAWKSTTAIDNVQCSHVVTNLIRQSMYMVCRQRGLTENRETGLLHFPVGLLPKNKLPFTTIQGKPSYVLGVGQRSRRGSKYRYHLAPIFSVRRDLVDGYCVLLRIRILITDEAGATFPSSGVLSRRKHLCKSWWNAEWFKRHLAVLQFISNGGEAVTFGTGDEEVRVSSTFESFNVAFGINEDGLAKKRTKEEDRMLGNTDGEETEENEIAMVLPDEDDNSR